MIPSILQDINISGTKNSKHSHLPPSDIHHMNIMNARSTDVPNTKQPLLLVTCDCKHIKDIVIAMEQWSIHIGYEETNDVRACQYCGNCHMSVWNSGNGWHKPLN